MAVGVEVFHSSVEAAQHGPKGLLGCLDFAKSCGARGAQPTNYMLEDGKGGFLKAAEIMSAFGERGLLVDGVSAHGPFWAQTTAWTGSKTIRRFIPADVAQKSPRQIERWTEDYLLRLFDLTVEIGGLVMPMFWGVAFGWEVATGYLWGPWDGPGYDLIAEGKERFVKKTEKLRRRAQELGIKPCHEIHPNTGALCSDDFLMLVEICDGDPCLGVIADPSHCAEGEPWWVRFPKVGSRVYANHLKNHAVIHGRPLRSMIADWQKRGMQFTDLPSGDLNLVRFVEMLVQIGYPQRYCQLMGTKTAPLVVEAESAYRDLDATSANGIAYARDELCFPLATESFEKGMGVADT